jgi:hypothetical protein
MVMEEDLVVEDLVLEVANLEEQVQQDRETVVVMVTGEVVEMVMEEEVAV